MILPGMGVISEIVSLLFAQAHFWLQVRGFRQLGIAVVGFLVWAHHMFVAGISLYAALIFSFLSYLVAVPSAIKVFNWTATMYKGSITYRDADALRLGFIGLFTIGGLTGLFLAALGIDVHVTDTYFVVAHFHYVMVGGMVMAYLGGMHFWWPKITGRMYPEGWARLAALMVFARLQPHILPAIYSRVPGHAAPVLGLLPLAGIPGAECALDRGSHRFWPSAICCRWSISSGRCAMASRAPDNPWNAAGLEWTIPSPPPTFNFEEQPVVTWEAYNYDERPSRRRSRLHTSPPATASEKRTRTLPSCITSHTAEQQKDAASLGMWIFLVTEIMFFGGMFCAYLVYRFWYFGDFAAGSSSLDLTLGTVNTIVLIGSSLTVAMAVRCAQVGKQKAVVVYLLLTLFLGLAFLGIKAKEYKA